MDTQRLSMGNLAVMVAIASVIWTIVYAADVQKVNNCCKSVSKDEVTDPIISYRLQHHRFPCVKAVILETERGKFCISPRASWVQKKICQFKAQKKNKPTPITVVQHVTSRPPPTSSSSISNITHVGGSTQTNHSR